jgi:hypothetical protein
MKRLVVVGLVALSVATCSKRASVSIRNRSQTEVREVRIEGRCFGEEVGALAPAGSATVRVEPCGESGVQVTFSADGKIHRSPQLGYIEASASYSLQLSIEPDLTVRESSR